MLQHCASYGFIYESVLFVFFLFFSFYFSFISFAIKTNTLHLPVSFRKTFFIWFLFIIVLMWRNYFVLRFPNYLREDQCVMKWLCKCCSWYCTIMRSETFTRSSSSSLQQYEYVSTMKMYLHRQLKIYFICFLINIKYHNERIIP